MVKMNEHGQHLVTSWWTSVAVGIGGSLLVGLIALAFLWPTKTAAPHEVPIAITGNSQQVAMVTKAIETNAGDKIELVQVDTRDAAIDKMQHREAYGAIVLSAKPEVLTASANGQAANAIIINLATTLEASLDAAVQAKLPAGVYGSTITVTKTDVIPAYNTSFDIAQLAMPIVFGGTIGSILVLVLTHGRYRRLLALAIYAVLAGNVMFLILHTWFDVLPGDYWPIVGAFTLGIFATSSFVAGMYTLLGLPGMALAAVTNLLIANPMSGIAIPPTFMPWIWGDIGQLFTVGASGTLLRGAIYFPVAEVVTTPTIVLSIWSVLGVVAMLSRDREPFSH